LYALLSSEVEVEGGRERGASGPRATLCGVEVGVQPQSLPVVLRLSALFALDAFGGGFTMLTFLAFWFRGRWGLDLAALGGVLAGINVVAGASSMAAGCMVRRFGAVETMVYTHLPSNILLMLVPLMPSAASAVAMLLVRFSISQMDVPARQAYVAMLIDADERSAANGITTVARSLGLIFSPLLLGPFMAAAPASTTFDAPFYIAGVVKAVYDVIVWVQFRAVKRARG
jgi:predicted MFS family arabinose efflux permease